MDLRSGEIMIHNEFDPERKAIINPEDCIKPIEGFPELCVGIFSKPTMDWLLDKFGGQEISHFSTCIGRMPIYKVNAFGTEAAVFMPLVGGPGAASTMEESIPMGGKYFVYFGAAGVLQKGISHGKLLLPTAAVRDEGLSYHYLPAADEIELAGENVQACRNAMNELGVPFAEGKTWTTDAFYRETRAKAAKRKEQGCISVEMECASLAAVAQFRGVPFAEFFYATDTVDDEGWDVGILPDKGAGLEEVCFRVAVETGKNMAKLGRGPGGQAPLAGFGAEPQGLAAERSEEAKI